MVQRILLNHYLARTAGMLSGARRGAMMLIATLLFTLTAQTAWAAIGGTGTQSDPYTINSADDWNTFASNVSNGTTYQDKFVKLTDDISVTTMVGTSEHPFKGKFNGGGHILTVAYGTSDSYFNEEFVAPFRFVDGSDFRFLQVSGEIYTSQGYAGGLVAHANSDNTFFHCISDVIIRSSMDGEGKHGGFVGIAFGSENSLTFTNCLSKVNISGDNLTGCAGFVGWHEGSMAVFRNCYFKGNILQTTKSHAFARNGASTSKCYTDRPIPKANNYQGEYTGLLSVDQILSGLGAGWEKKNGAIVPILDGDNLATCTITDLQNVYLWNGSVINITYSVSALDGSQLVKGTHYEATITKDESESEVKDKGTYTLTLTGINDYTGSKSVNFTVSDCPEGLSVDDDYQSDQIGYYYVNMPSGADNTKTITIPDGFKSSFKVYDDGGKSGDYTIYSDWGFRRVIVIEAPQGYKIQLTGTVRVFERDDLLHARLKIYNGTSSDLGTPIGNEQYGNGSDSGEDIGMLVSDGETVTLVFSGIDTNSSDTGLDLTVKLINSQDSHNIIINTATGGSVASDNNSAKLDDIVTLTATPADNTYKLNSIIVTDADNNTIPLSNGMCWYSGTNTANFSMPGSAVTVTPVFTNNWTATEGGLSIMMPTNGNIDASHIPSAVQSFKVSYNQTLVTGTSTLKLTVPDGYLMQLSGTAHVSLYIQSASNQQKSKFYVYDGEDNSADKMIDVSTNLEVDNNYSAVISTGQSMFIYCESPKDTYWTLDLTITLIPVAEHNVTINNNITHGQVARNKATAAPNETVTLTITPDEGYVLQSITVTDGDGAISLTPSATDASWGDASYYTASQFTFKMRSSDATVNATFMPKTEFFVNMPKTDQRDFTIPAGTTSFKVYDNSGKNGSYFINDNGKLLLTAPEGYAMEVAGYVKLYHSSNDDDYLDIYDGNSTSATSLGRFKNTVRNGYYDNNNNWHDTPTTSVDATSTTNQMLLHFVTNGNGYVNNGGGVYLTVTLKKLMTNVDITATVPNQTLEGPNSPFVNIYNKFNYVNSSYSESSVQDFITGMGVVVMDGSTPLSLGTDYQFGSVTYANGDPITTSAIDDECKVEIVGIGNYAGSRWETFQVIAPDANGTWGDNNLAWSFDGDSKTLTITGTGEMKAAASFTDYPWYGSANYIETVTIGDGVTSIAAYAFGSNGTVTPYSNLTSVSLPSTLETIGDNAFAYSGLTSINIPVSVTNIDYAAFNQCTSLASITLNGGVTIGDAAFPTNANTTVTIANSLTLHNGTEEISGDITDMNKLNGKTLRVAIPYIKNGQTAYCTNFTVLDNTMTTISEGWYVVKSDVTFSGNLSTNASGDVHIILCDGATLTANYIVFDHSNRLYIYGQSQGTGTVNISGGIEAANSLQIYGGIINAAGNIDCPTGSVGIYGGTVTAGSLKALNIGSQIRLGGATVKANNYSAHNGVTITNGITYYDGTGASYPAGNLTSDQISAIRGKTLRTYDYRSGTCGKDDPATGDVDESQNVTWMLTGNTLTISGTGAMADYAEASGQPWTAMHSDINAIVIEDGVTSIGNYAFSLCEYVTSGVSIPASVTSIGNYSFNYCSMTSLTIPSNSSLETIGSFAFNCAGFGSVTIPASVKSIGNNAFDGSAALTTVTLNSNPFIGESAFYSSTAVTMNLTANLADGAYWATFYNKNYSFEADANTQVFKAELVGTKITLHEVANRVVDAGEGVVLKTTGGGNPEMTLTTSASGDSQNNSLAGVSAPAGVTADGTMYVLNNGSNGVGFYKLTAGKTLGVGKAYLYYSGTTAPGFFGLDVDNENTTAINEHELNESHELSGAWYDLQGRKIANGQKPTAKGLYIVNGKKVMIK